MGMNSVEVDHGVLNADADRVLGEIPPEFSKQPAPQSQPIAGEVMPPAELTMEQIQEIASKHYRAGAGMLVSQACDILVPGWHITHEERSNIADAVAIAAAAWFPDQQLPPKVVACIAVAASLFNVVDARRDPITGELPPRSHPPRSPRPAATDASPAPA